MGSMIKIKHHGSFSKTERFFNKAIRRDYLNVMEKYAEFGLAVLREATPTDTGKTKASWNYIIEEKEKGKVTIAYTNSNVNDGVSVVLLLMYGHGTQDGGYVQGEDFVHPAIRPVFHELVNKIWKEVNS